MYESWSTSTDSYFFFFNDTATTEIYTLSLHDALPIFRFAKQVLLPLFLRLKKAGPFAGPANGDRKSTRLNSSHANISYAVFCLKKKKQTQSVPHDHTSKMHSIQTDLTLNIYLKTKVTT